MKHFLKCKYDPGYSQRWVVFNIFYNERKHKLRIKYIDFFSTPCISASIVYFSLVAIYFLPPSQHALPYVELIKDYCLINISN